MRIYTKFGDKGKTTLLGGATVSKNDLHVEAYGSVDELNAILGTVIAFCDIPELTVSLKKIQMDLFVIGAELASKGEKTKTISLMRIEDLEAEIDLIAPELPPLHNFILPGGSRTSSLLHLARTVCRRAERKVVALQENEKINPDILTYLNRVGDLLFMHARQTNYRKKVDEVVWKGH
ncbi:cob(I)yrinic acid a,c-diamide adenosyltransferase [Candidatus Micrarchaeota archaeon]|nr:cob(I)yrinic acid a,c-diamide adenosyltransferase [Candidatus Micrarchaeota archaeon]